MPISFDNVEIQNLDKTKNNSAATFEEKYHQKVSRCQFLMVKHTPPGAAGPQS